jgi:hypothetical protein
MNNVEEALPIMLIYFGTKLATEVLFYFIKKIL